MSHFDWYITKKTQTWRLPKNESFIEKWSVFALAFLRRGITSGQKW
jgi:hypothetical protein